MIDSENSLDKEYMKDSSSDTKGPPFGVSPDTIHQVVLCFSSFSPFLLLAAELNVYPLMYISLLLLSCTFHIGAQLAVNSDLVSMTPAPLSSNQMTQLLSPGTTNALQIFSTDSSIILETVNALDSAFTENGSCISFHSLPAIK